MVKEDIMQSTERKENVEGLGKKNKRSIWWTAYQTINKQDGENTTPAVVGKFVEEEKKRKGRTRKDLNDVVTQIWEKKSNQLERQG